jgi:hypothetical protein
MFLSFASYLKHNTTIHVTYLISFVVFFLAKSLIFQLIEYSIIQSLVCSVQNSLLLRWHVKYWCANLCLDFHDKASSIIVAFAILSLLKQYITTLLIGYLCQINTISNCLKFEPSIKTSCFI